MKKVLSCLSALAVLLSVFLTLPLTAAAADTLSIRVLNDFEETTLTGTNSSMGNTGGQSNSYATGGHRGTTALKMSSSTGGWLRYMVYSYASNWLASSWRDDWQNASYLQFWAKNVGSGNLTVALTSMKKDNGALDNYQEYDVTAAAQFIGSTDGGNTWTNLTKQLNGNGVYEVIIPAGFEGWVRLELSTANLSFPDTAWGLYDGQIGHLQMTFGLGATTAYIDDVALAGTFSDTIEDYQFASFDTYKAGTPVISSAPVVVTPVTMKTVKHVRVLQDFSDASIVSANAAMLSSGAQSNSYAAGGYYGSTALKMYNDNNGYLNYLMYSYTVDSGRTAWRKNWQEATYLQFWAKSEGPGVTTVAFSSLKKDSGTLDHYEEFDFTSSAQFVGSTDGGETWYELTKQAVDGGGYEIVIPAGFEGIVRVELNTSTLAYPDTAWGMYDGEIAHMKMTFGVQNSTVYIDDIALAGNFSDNVPGYQFNEADYLAGDFTEKFPEESILSQLNAGSKDISCTVNSNIPVPASIMSALKSKGATFRYTVVDAQGVGLYTWTLVGSELTGTAAFHSQVTMKAITRKDGVMTKTVFVEGGDVAGAYLSVNVSKDFPSFAKLYLYAMDTESTGELIAGGHVVSNTGWYTLDPTKNGNYLMADMPMDITLDGDIVLEEVNYIRVLQDFSDANRTEANAAIVSTGGQANSFVSGGISGSTALQMYNDNSGWLEYVIYSYDAAGAAATWRDDWQQAKYLQFWIKNAGSGTATVSFTSMKKDSGAIDNHEEFDVTEYARFVGSTDGGSTWQSLEKQLNDNGVYEVIIPVGFEGYVRLALNETNLAFPDTSWGVYSGQIGKLEMTFGVKNSTVYVDDVALAGNFTSMVTGYQFAVADYPHVHTWMAASCTIPKVCTTCGIAEGAPLGHSWQDATCTAPKTCTTCGTTEGAAAGHSWQAATCTAPKTCSACGATEGAALGHSWQDATCTAPKTCANCGMTTGVAAGHQYFNACDAHCMICGELTNPDATHTIGHTAAVEATCQQNGNVEYWYCEICGTCWLDEALTQQTNRMSIVTSTDHVYEDGACKWCGEADPDAPTEPEIGTLVSTEVKSGITFQLYQLEDGTHKLVVSGAGTVPTWTNIQAYKSKATITAVEIGEGVTELAYGAFRDLTALAEVKLPSTLKVINAVVFSKCSALTSVVIPEGVTTIGNKAFQYTGLTSVSIPASVTSLGEAVFVYCTNLKSATFANGNRTNLTIGKQCFSYCTSLTDITLGTRVRVLGKYAFEHCDSLTAVTIPGHINTLDTGAFRFCENIVDVTLEEGVKLMGAHSFLNGSSIKNINLPASLTSLGAWSFSNCFALEEVVIPEGITIVTKRVFNNCRALKKVTMPDTVTEIQDYAFRYCLQLSEINTPSALTKVGEFAFYNCRALPVIIIPEGVTSISKMGYSYCVGADTVYIDSATIAAGLTGNAVYGDLIKNTNTIALRADLTATSYVTANYTVVGSETVNGVEYVTYSK